LVRAREHTGISVRAVEQVAAGDATVDACTALARKPCNAVARVITAGLLSKATTDGDVAFVGGIAAIPVLLAGPTADDEAARKLLAAGR
jgi:hypothetical protein